MLYLIRRSNKAWRDRGSHNKQAFLTSNIKHQFYNIPTKYPATPSSSPLHHLGCQFPPRSYVVRFKIRAQIHSRVQKNVELRHDKRRRCDRIAQPFPTKTVYTFPSINLHLHSAFQLIRHCMTITGPRQSSFPILLDGNGHAQRATSVKIFDHKFIQGLNR